MAARLQHPRCFAHDFLGLILSQGSESRIHPKDIAAAARHYDCIGGGLQGRGLDPQLLFGRPARAPLSKFAQRPLDRRTEPMQPMGKSSFFSLLALISSSRLAPLMN